MSTSVEPPHHAHAQVRRAAELLSCLDQQQVPYCVIGSARYGLDASVRDLDIVVRPGDTRTVIRTVAQFCRSLGGQVVNVVRHEGDAHYVTCVWPSETGELAPFHFDVHGDLSVRGRTFLRAEEILTGRTTTRAGEEAPPGFWVAAPAVEFVSALLKQVDRQTLTDRAAARLSAEWKRDAPAALAQVRRFWSGSPVDLLAGAAVTGDWSGVRAHLPQLRTSLRFPLMAAWTRAIRAWRRGAQRLRHPTGLTVAFLGIDGCGKSTAIRGITAVLKPIFARTRYFHFKPQVVRPPTRPADTPIVHPPGKADGISLRSITRLVYYLLDYWIGYACKVWPPRLRTTLVLFDRYFYDLSIDPIWLRHRGAMALAGLVDGWVPAPDVVIHLDAPAEVARSRKDDVPRLVEAARQRNEYLGLARRLPNAHVVDATQPDDQVARAVTRIILDYMTARTARQWEWDPVPLAGEHVPAASP
jgi:thymidylate kinase